MTLCYASSLCISKHLWPVGLYLSFVSLHIFFLPVVLLFSLPCWRFALCRRLYLCIAFCFDLCRSWVRVGEADERNKEEWRKGYHDWRIALLLLQLLVSLPLLSITVLFLSSPATYSAFFLPLCRRFTKCCLFYGFCFFSFLHLPWLLIRLSFSLLINYYHVCRLALSVRLCHHPLNTFLSCSYFYRLLYTSSNSLILSCFRSFVSSTVLRRCQCSFYPLATDVRLLFWCSLARTGALLMCLSVSFVIYHSVHFCFLFRKTKELRSKELHRHLSVVDKERIGSLSLFLEEEGSSLRLWRCAYLFSIHFALIVFEWSDHSCLFSFGLLSPLFRLLFLFQMFVFRNVNWRRCVSFLFVCSFHPAVFFHFFAWLFCLFTHSFLQDYVPTISKKRKAEYE